MWNAVITYWYTESVKENQKYCNNGNHSKPLEKDESIDINLYGV